MVVLDFLMLLFLCFVFHELGHYIYYESKGIPTYFKWNKKGLGLYTDEDLNRKDIINGIFSGIFLGLLPFLFYIDLAPYWLYSAFIIYFIGCITDFKLLWRA